MIHGQMFEEMETGDSAFGRKEDREQRTKDYRCVKKVLLHNYLKIAF